MDELGYLFKNFLTPEIKAGSLEDKCWRRIVKIWTNFAKFGNQEIQDQDFEWKPVTLDQINYLAIDQTLKLLRDPDKERMELWQDILAKSPSFLR